MRKRVSGNNWRASLILAPLFSFLLVATGKTQAVEICASGQKLQIQIAAQTYDDMRADSPAKRQRGLSGRRELTAQSGMWFEFQNAGFHGFWMQDMNFPIDLIWIGPSHRVLGAITLQPCLTASCPIYMPPAPVSHVLEINAGEFAGKVGDAVTWGCVKL
jgi:uncharacterized membrane protein (UPF0127 family)